ncbi:MAG: hypothetical protein ABGY75_06505, partial [Gemmataceae bacterium]
ETNDGAGTIARPASERIHPMLNHTERFIINDRLLDLADELSNGIDPDFDAASDDLEREFAELRLQLGSFEQEGV